MKEHTIWSDDLYRLHDEETLDMLKEDWGVDTENEYALFDALNELNNMRFDDELVNLKGIEFDKPLVIMANIGCWNGRFESYKIADEPLVELFDYMSGSGEIANIYVEDNSFYVIETHHDSSNYYEVRTFKDDCPQAILDNFEDDLYEFDQALNILKNYTRPIGQDIAKIYGWTD